jgi:hypothetical protein
MQLLIELHWTHSKKSWNSLANKKLLLRSPMTHYRFHKSLIVNPEFKHLNKIQTLKIHSFSSHSNIKFLFIKSTCKWSLVFTSSNSTGTHILFSLLSSDHIYSCVSISPPFTFECLNQSLWSFVRIILYPILSERRTSWLPRISLCLYVPLAGQRLGKYVIHAMIELLDVSFSMLSVSYLGT